MSAWCATDPRAVTRRWIIGLALALLLTVAAYLASPYWALRRFSGAVRSGDTAELSNAVDFPAVRDSLKPQVAAGLANKLDEARLKGDALAALGTAFAPALADRVLDTAVTPEGVAMLVRGRLPSATAAGARADDRRIAAHISWVDLDHISVQPRYAGSARPGPILSFERRGLFSWKLTGVELPDWMLTYGEGSDAPPR